MAARGQAPCQADHCQQGDQGEHDGHLQVSGTGLEGRSFTHIGGAGEESARETICTECCQRAFFPSMHWAADILSLSMIFTEMEERVLGHWK
jgi:hypothetical protein